MKDSLIRPFTPWVTSGIVYAIDPETGVEEVVQTPEEIEAERIAAIVADAESQSTAVSNDPTGSLQAATTKAGNVQGQLDSLLPQLAANPGLQTQVDSLITQLSAAEQTQTQAYAQQQQALQLSQQGMVSNANTNPTALLEQATVAETQVTPGQLVDPAAGQAPAVGLADTAVVDPSTVALAVAPAPTTTNTMDAVLTEAAAEGIVDSTVAATGGPSAQATVQGQLVSLMEDFEGGATPIWASGAMRKAMGTMQARGMGASSLAGAAVVQAAMESALSIATQDAGTNAQFEMQSLNNEQQTTIFKTQQRMASLFSDQSATNAASQFNATSQNQTDQFFSGLEARSSEFNAAQVNAIRQFNAGETNAIEKFNTTLEAQRDQFNTQNSLVISQSNAVWRQQTATASTAAQNIANLEYSRNVNAITGAALDQIWQRERDLMDYAFTSSEGELDRSTSIVLAKLSGDASLDAVKLREEFEGDRQASAFLGQLVTSFLF